MYRIIKTRQLAEKIILMEIEAKRVASSCEPGQFVIVKIDERGERIPLTISNYDRSRGTVTVVFQVMGASTRKMATLKEGEEVQDFIGPLGRASEFVSEPVEVLKHKKILFVAGGVGTAPVYPQVKWLHERDIHADVIMGARNQQLLILEEEMRTVAGNLYVATDDGSYGIHGRVTDVIEDLVLNQGIVYDLCVAIGPMIMMKFVSQLTRKLNLPTIVSLNPIMVDGTGMCGACRVTVGGQVQFACVDGPEFDGHLVNFDEAMNRQQMYKSEEGRTLLKHHEGATHRPDGCGCEEDRK